MSHGPRPNPGHRGYLTPDRKEAIARKVRAIRNAGSVNGRATQFRMKDQDFAEAIGIPRGTEAVGTLRKYLKEIDALDVLL